MRNTPCQHHARIQLKVYFLRPPAEAEPPHLWPRPLHLLKHQLRVIESISCSLFSLSVPSQGRKSWRSSHADKKHAAAHGRACSPARPGTRRPRWRSGKKMAARSKQKAEVDKKAAHLTGMSLLQGLLCLSVTSLLQLSNHHPPHLSTTPA